MNNIHIIFHKKHSKTLTKYWNRNLRRIKEVFTDNSCSTEYILYRIPYVNTKSTEFKKLINKLSEYIEYDIVNIKQPYHLKLNYSRIRKFTKYIKKDHK